MIQRFLSMLGEVAPLREIDVAPYEKFSKNLMFFRVKAYEMDGVGKLSLISLRAALGLLRMNLLSFTPLEKDMPVMNMDYIGSPRRKSLMLSLYNTQLEELDFRAMDDVKRKYSAVPDLPPTKKWFGALQLSPTMAKVGKNRELEAIGSEWLGAYIAMLQTAPSCDRDAKQARVRKYVDGLFTHGGIYTDLVKSLIGGEAANQLFRRFILFSDD